VTAYYNMLLFQRHSETLLELEGRAAYHLTVDPDVDTVGAHSQCTSAEIVDVLAAIDPEVRA